MISTSCYDIESSANQFSITEVVDLLMERVGTLELESSGILTVDLPTTYLYGDGKGLDVIVDKSIKISSQGATIYGEIITVLFEQFPKLYPNIDEIKAKDLVDSHGVEREVRERVVRLAREEIQSILDFLQKGVGEISTLEKVTTGILDVENGGECEFCNGRERNGDCWTRLIQLLE